MKNQPREEVFGRISLRTSCQKLRSGAPKSLKKQAFWHGHPVRMSTKKLRADLSFPIVRTSLTTTRDRNLQFRGAVFTGGSPLDCLLYVQFSKTSPLKSGESSEKSSGENRGKSRRVCGCHGFFGPELGYAHMILAELGERDLQLIS